MTEISKYAPEVGVRFTGRLVRRVWEGRTMIFELVEPWNGLLPGAEVEVLRYRYLWAPFSAMREGDRISFIPVRKIHCPLKVLWIFEYGAPVTEPLGELIQEEHERSR